MCLPENLELMKWSIGFCLLFLSYGMTHGQHVVAFLNTLPEKVATESAYRFAKKQKAADIPFEIIRGMIVVQAHLDGQPGYFVVDTGAPLMVVNQTPNAEQSQQAKSFAKAVSYAPQIIDHFEWAGLTTKKLDALALDISHLEASTQRSLSGMVGYNALYNYEVLFDYSQNRMTLYSPRRNELHRVATPLMEIPFELQGHLPVVVVQSGTQKFNLGIDTGASVNLFDRRWLSDLPQEVLIHLVQEEVRGFDQVLNPVPAALVSGMTLQGMALDEQMSYLFTDLQHLQVDTNLKIDGLLGFPFLKNLVFSINYAKRKLYIWQINEVR